MDNKEALKKLIPMSDEEIENSYDEDIKMIAPVLTETSINMNSPTKTVYGDFSMNSFVIVDTPEDTYCENKTNRFKDDKNTIKEDVYMESILGLFKSLSVKIDSFYDMRSTEKDIIEKLSAYLTVNDTKSALQCIQEYKNDGNIDFMTVYHSLLQKTIPDFLISLRQKLITIREDLFTYHNCYKEVEDKLYKKAEECERLKNIINQQSKDFKTQIDGLVLENTNMKDDLLKIYNGYSTEKNLESQLEVDIIRNIREVLHQKCEVIDDLREEVLKKDEIIGQFERKAQMFEVTHLNSQVDSLKQTQHKLQAENLNLTNIVNKLSEKNTKLKQELIFFNNEMKKAMEAINRKNETISRQKSLIELFQDKLGGNESFPIEELRRKKKEIEERLAKETDYFVKQDLKKEKEDCAKRLSDFLMLQSNKH